MAASPDSNVFVLNRLEWSLKAKRGYAGLHRAAQEEAKTILGLCHACIRNLPPEHPYQLEDGTVSCYGSFTAYEYVGRLVEVTFTHFHDEKKLRVIDVRPRPPRGGGGGRLLPVGTPSQSSPIRDLCDARGTLHRAVEGVSAALWGIMDPADRAFMYSCERDRPVFAAKKVKAFVSHSVGGNVWPLRLHLLLVRGSADWLDWHALDHLARQAERDGFARAIHRLCTSATKAKPAMLAYATVRGSRGRRIVQSAGVCIPAEPGRKAIVLLAPGSMSDGAITASQALLPLLTWCAGVAGRIGGGVGAAVRVGREAGGDNADCDRLVDLEGIAFNKRCNRADDDMLIGGGEDFVCGGAGDDLLSGGRAGGINADGNSMEPETQCWFANAYRMNQSWCFFESNGGDVGDTASDNGVVVVLPEEAQAPFLSVDGRGGGLEVLRTLGAVHMKAMPEKTSAVINDLLEGARYNAFGLDAASIIALHRSFGELCEKRGKPAVRVKGGWSLWAPQFAFDASQLRIEFNLVDRLASLMRIKKPD